MAAAAVDLAPDPPPVAALTLPALLESVAALAPADAADAYLRWIAANARSPLFHVACFNAGTTLSSLQREAEAEACYRQALQAQPQFAPAHLNLGHLCERRGDVDGALSQWRQALAHATAAEYRLHALNNSARLLETQRRLPEAEALMRRSLEMKAEQFDVIQHYVHIRQKQCAWPLYESVGAVTQNQLLIGTSALAMMNVSDDPALQLMAALRFAAERVPKAAPTPLHAAGKRSGKVRIGYLSGDLHMHAVGLLTAELFELHDRSRFEIWAFCWTPESQQPLRRRILAAMDHHVRLAGVDDSTAARLVAEAGIDVLVDLQGLTNGARPSILAQRPAPVQVSYLGLPGTSGLPGVDWIVADGYVLPPEAERWYTERPIRLPHCYQVSDRRRQMGAVPTRAACGLPETGFVYGSFNNNHKFTPEIFDAWMRVLAQVPGSVLWLLADNDTARRNMLQRAALANVASERLIFAPRAAPADYLARFCCIDLMLDTFPYNAGTTASDALWAGTPIVTLSGRSYISRMAGSLLSAVGLPDLITDTLAAYEKLAVELGRNPLRVASYKRYLAEHGRASPLFDMPATVRALESAFERLALERR